jgi:hypothetical protein
MRGRLFRVLLAVSAAALFGAGGAYATSLPSSYLGHGGPVPTLGCASSQIGGDLDASGTRFADVETVSHENCGLYSSLDVQATSPWEARPPRPTTTRPAC